MNLYSKTQPLPSSNFNIASDDLKQIGRWTLLTTTQPVKFDSHTVQSKLIHSGNIIPAENLGQQSLPADGIIINSVSYRAVIHTADCVPLLVTSENQAALLHLSRKSIVNGLLDNLTTFIAPKDIDHIHVGPHICEFHFDFTDEDLFVRHFRSRWPQAAHFYKGKLYLSLKKAMQTFFDEWQVHPGRISYDGRCTYENLSLPSYRRHNANGDKEKLGSLYTIVWQE